MILELEFWALTPIFQYNVIKVRSFKYLNPHSGLLLEWYLFTILIELKCSDLLILEIIQAIVHLACIE